MLCFQHAIHLAYQLKVHLKKYTIIMIEDNVIPLREGGFYLASSLMWLVFRVIIQP